MSKPETGGSAFPILPPVDSDGRAPTDYPFPDSGMTLRQWYAGKVVSGLVVSDPATNLDPTQLAKFAFAVADAMIAEGSK